MYNLVITLILPDPLDGFHLAPQKTQKQGKGKDYNHLIAVRKTKEMAKGKRKERGEKVVGGDKCSCCDLINPEQLEKYTDAECQSGLARIEGPDKTPEQGALNNADVYGKPA